MDRTRKNGFTLIELLVVITIIGLLSATILSSLGTARAKARDVRRITDLKEIQAALALYYNTNGSYPGVADGINCWPENPPSQAPIQGWAGDHIQYPTCYTVLKNKLAPFMPNLPVDPQNTPTDPAGYKTYWYGTVYNGQGYILAIYPEVLTTRGDNCYPYAGWYCVGENWQ